MTATPEEPGPWLPESTSAELSLSVLRRFGFKCVVFTAWAGLQACLGHGFGRQLAFMAFASATLSLGLAVWQSDRIRSPHWTYFDEAAWFLALGSAMRWIC